MEVYIIPNRAIQCIKNLTITIQDKLFRFSSGIKVTPLSRTTCQIFPIGKRSHFHGSRLFNTNLPSKMFMIVNAQNDVKVAPMKRVFWGW